MRKGIIVQSTEGLNGAQQIKPAAHIEWGGLREILNDYPGME